MTDNYYDANLENDVIEIDLCNKGTGATYARAAVTGINTLGQVAQEYGADIGIDTNKLTYIFTNKRTGASTSDANETVASLGLQNGDVLAIVDDGKVAGTDEIEIDLVNKISGATYARAVVTGVNTLGQVVNEYGPDIGINMTAGNYQFENKRTYISTSDTSETVDGLGLQNGDVLAISDDNRVA